jgi:predicted lipid-binding transport protein (Tim44 family)
MRGKWVARGAMVACALLVGIVAMAHDAEARRFGGGKSFGRQSTNVAPQPAQPPSRDAAAPRQAPEQAGQPTRPAGNRWIGPLAGLAAGLGIAALLSHLGLAGPAMEMLASLFMIGLLVLAGLFVWRMLRGQRAGPNRTPQALEPAYGAGTEQPSLAYAGGARPGSVMDSFRSGHAGSSSASNDEGTASTATAAPWGVPADFDVEGFVRSAKVHFLRLQAAWDARDLADIREFTTPEVFAEVRMQMAEEKATASHTDVVTLDAQLLGIDAGPADYLASVRFHGTMREGEQSSAEAFEEVWNLSKPKDGRTGWLLAGIQQLH